MCFDKWYILSAKHGLLNPNDEVNPYNLTLNKIGVDRRKEWANSIFIDLMKIVEPNSTFIFLAGERYREFLIPQLEKAGYKTEVPMKGLSIGMQLSWLNSQIYKCETLKNLDRFYKLIGILTDGLGGFRVFNKCTGKLNWPSRGVYFIFENVETRNLKPYVPRVVRVGTHCVSKNSKSSFWHRLITHRGTEDGNGNHRSSIFRLHVGKALMNKYPSKFNTPSWGIGQTANKEVRSTESKLETLVSDTIGKMKLLWVAIEDEASPFSDRAYIERNSIGLITALSPPIDLPSNDWLGRYSGRKRIRDSGLWNLDFYQYEYDPAFLDIFEKYVYATIKVNGPIHNSIAPKNWHKIKKKASYNQLQLFTGY